MPRPKSRSPTDDQTIHMPLTPFPVFEFHPDEIPGVTAAMYGEQPRDFKGHGVVSQFCYRCGTQTELYSTNCHHDCFEFCETCGGFTLHYTTKRN
jgi:hypothetical protein